MSSLCEEHAVAMVCRTLGFSRAGHYAGKRASSRERQDQVLKDRILAIYRDNLCVYGYPRMDLALRAEGVSSSRRRIARLMRELGIQGRRRGRFKPVCTDSRHTLGYDPNLLGEVEETGVAHQAWVSDTTYIRCRQGWAYLAVTMDLHSRYVVGWSVSSVNDSGLTVEALEKARRGYPEARPMHHSDRGCTYASRGFRKCLKEIEAARSMSRKGNCYDNAAMESFFGTLKAECVHGLVYRSVEEAHQALFEYIEGFYNPRRIHTSIGMSPLQKLQQCKLS